MGYGGTLDWVITAILFVATILLFTGKGNFLILGFRNKNPEIEKVYNIPKLTKTTGCITLCMGLVQLVMALVGDKIQILTYIYIPVVILVFGVGVYVINHKCKK